MNNLQARALEKAKSQTPEEKASTIRAVAYYPPLKTSVNNAVIN